MSPSTQARANRLNISIANHSVSVGKSDLGWSERVNLYGRQVMVLQRNSKHVLHSMAPKPNTKPWKLGNFYRLHTLVGTAALSVKAEVLVSRFLYWQIRNL